MEIIEFEDGGCRYVVWELSDQDLDEFATRVDPFLTESIQAIATEHERDPAEWLVISTWSIGGRLIVAPSQEGPAGSRRIQYELTSGYWEREFERIGDELETDEERTRAWEAIDSQVWEQVRVALVNGEASRRLADARKIHPFRLAMYDYNFGEGIFRLPELDPEATAFMQQELARRRQGERY